MQTEHDQDLPQAAHNSAQQDAVKVCDRIECNAQTIAQQRGDGSDDPQREDKGDAAGDKRHKKQLAGIRDELFILLLEPCCKCDGADDGENAGGVVAGSRHNDRDPEQVGDIHAGSGGQVRVQQRCTNGHTLQLRQAKLFGGGVGQQHGHKVEEAVAQRVQDIVGGAGAAEYADGNEQGDKALYDTGGSQHAQTGGKHCRNDADEGIEQALLFLGGFGAAGGVAVIVHCAARGNVTHGAHSVVHIGNLLTDDHHILSAGLDHGHDAVGLFQHIGVCLALVLQFEAQAGHAVGKGHDIALAANILDDNARKTIIFTSHK